jgi:CheY-like chemotaxis protein
VRATQRQPRILLIEDNPGDVELTREALEQAAPQALLSIARDGMEATEFLRRRGRFDSAPAPDLVLLDLNLPKKTGRDVLRDVKQDPTLRHIPVIVFTGSGASDDILSSYDLHANGYVTKPEHAGEISTTMRTLVQFWLGVARLPTLPPR